MSFRAVEEEPEKGRSLGLEERDDKGPNRVGDGIMEAEREEIAIELALVIDGGSSARMEEKLATLLAQSQRYPNQFL